MLRKRDRIKYVVIGGAIGLSTILSAKQNQPNIVIIYADDLGYTDIGVNGAKYYETPNIDALAKKGILFTAAYANSPNCAPSRGALYSGQYCGRTGMYNVGYAERGKAENRSLIPPVNRVDLSLDKKTFGDAMTGLGYNCVQFGKWHLGYSKATIPPKRGFEARWTTGPFKGLFMSEIFVHPSRWAHFHYGPSFGNSKEKGDGAFHFIFGDFDDPRNNRAEDFKVCDEKIIKRGTYLSDYMDQKVPLMLADLKAQKKPFLLMVNKFLVHGPVNAPKKEIKIFQDKPADRNDKNPVFAAMVKKLDDSVGIIMDSIQKLDLLDNTVVFFYSDNGGVGGYHRLGIDGAPEHTDNFPLKGGKTMLYEGGIRVPMIAYSKGKIKPGQVCDEPVASIDFFPTLLELGGSEKKLFEKSTGQVLDGFSMVPLFNNPKSKIDREYLAFHFPAYALGYFGKGKTRAYWRSTPHSVISTRKYKLVEHFVGEAKPGDGTRLELYDILNDIGETKNIAQSKPEITQTLYKKLCEWRKETGAKLPSKKSFEADSCAYAQGIVFSELDPIMKKVLICPEDIDGVLILDANPKKGSPAKLHSSYILTKINGEAVKNLSRLTQLFKKYLNKKVQLQVMFAGKKKTIAFKIEENIISKSLNKSELNDFQPFKIYSDTDKN